MASDHSAFQGEIPRNYDEGLGPNLFDHFGRVMAAKVSARAPEEVLEIAAGTGIVSRHIRDALAPSARLTSTDLNADMLEIARAKFDAAEPVRFLPANAQDLPFDDDSFDVVATQYGHMFFPDRARAYAEAARVLRPGGTYLFSTWGTREVNPYARIIQDVLVEVFAGDPPGFYLVPFSMGDPEAVLEELAMAGFEGARAETLHHEQTVADIAGFARGLVYGNPSIDEIHARTGDPEAVQDEVVARMKAEFGDEPAAMPLVSHFFEVTFG